MTCYEQFVRFGRCADLEWKGRVIVEIRRAPDLTDGAVRRARNGPARLRVLLGLSAAAAAASVLVACSSAGTS
jgi:hypothetical protein